MPIQFLFFCKSYNVRFLIDSSFNTKFAKISGIADFLLEVLCLLSIFFLNQCEIGIKEQSVSYGRIKKKTTNIDPAEF